MIPFVNKLLVSGQFKFEDGRTSIFDQPVMILPMEMVKVIMEKSLEDRKFAADIYDVAKRSIVDFQRSVAKRLNLTKREQSMDILFKLTQMSGYGDIRPMKVDYENSSATLHLRGLPSRELFGKYEGVKTADMYWCGLIAGGMSHVFKSDIDAIETRCAITGKESCEIVAAKKKHLHRHLKENELPKPAYF